MVFTLQAVTAPREAQAFIGESLVVGAGGALTSAAETVIKSPSAVPELVTKAGAAGGAVESSAAAGLLQRAGLIPQVGAGLLAFGAGAAIGTEICGALGIEGCWTLSSDAADPPNVTAGHWIWHSEPFQSAPAYSYIFRFDDNAYSAVVKGYAEKGCFSFDAPGGVSVVVPSLSPAAECLYEGEVVSRPKSEAIRYGMENRTLAYTGADDPEVPNTAFTPSSEWSKKLATVLSNPSSLGYPSPMVERAGQHIASQIPESGVADPYATTALVPNCGGLTYEQCAAKLEAEGLEPVKNTLGWQTADLAVAAGQVVGLQPDTLTEVEKGTAVTVAVNPAEAGMPVLVPAPQEHETYDHYVARLPAVLVPERQTVPESQLVPDAGPDAVLQVTPQPDSRADPEGETPLQVRTNPADAPPIGGAGGGGSCSAGIGAIDWSPLNQPLGNRFPFGVFGFFGGWIGEWEAGEGGPPEWTFTVIPAGVFGSDGVEVAPDFGAMAPVVSVARVVFLFASFVGLLWFLGTAAAKLQGDDS